MTTPYDVTPLIDGFTFTTIHEVRYFYFFSGNAEDRFALHELAGHIFSFRPFPLNAEDFLHLPPDDRVGATLISAIAAKFADHHNIVLFIVDHEDGPHPARSRKFESWYKQYGRADVVLYPGDIVGRSAVIRSAMLMHEKNPHREAALRQYQSLLDSFRK